MFSVPFLGRGKTSSSRRNRRSGRSHAAFVPRRMRGEALEDRRLLSGVPDWVLGAGGPPADARAAGGTDIGGEGYATGPVPGGAGFYGGGISGGHGNFLKSMYLSQ